MAAAVDVPLADVLAGDFLEWAHPDLAHMVFQDENLDKLTMFMRGCEESRGCGASARASGWGRCGRGFGRGRGHFGPMFGRGHDHGRGHRGCHGFPAGKPEAAAVDIQETAEAYEIIVEAPGWTKQQLHIQVEDSQLTISGNRDGSGPTDARVLRTERRDVNDFSRTFVLPSDVDDKAVTAKLDKGLLRLVLPKAPKTSSATVIPVGEPDESVPPRDVEDQAAASGVQKADNTAEQVDGLVEDWVDTQEEAEPSQDELDDKGKSPMHPRNA